MINYKEVINILGVEQFFSIIVLLIFHFIRAIRLHGIVKLYAEKFTLSKSIKLYYVGLAFAIVTPGRSGELYRIKMLNDSNIKYLDALKIFFIEKYTDATALLLFFILSFFIIFFPDFNFYLAILLSIAFSFLTVFILHIIGIFIKSKNIRVVDKVSGGSNIVKFFTEIFVIGSSKLFFLHIKTFIGWLIFLYALWIGVSSIYTLSLEDVIGVHIMNSAAVSIPISYMGYGIREIFLDEFVFKGSADNYIIASITIQYTIFYLVSIFIGLSIFISNKTFKRNQK
jgi:hypothetical protein